MKYLRLLMSLILIQTLCLPVQSESARSAYDRGVHAEAREQYDAAFQAYKQAFALKPKEPKYMTAYLRMRTTAGVMHVDNGRKLLDSLNFQAALAEFQQAAEIDPTNLLAVEEMRRVSILIKRQQESGKKFSTIIESPLAQQARDLEGPPTLQPSPDTPITLRMTTTADNVYKTIGKLGGINVLFDLDYKPQKITIELNEVRMDEALKMVALESKTFWRPISSTAIFVAADSKKKDLETSVLKTFYLQNVSNQAELQEVVGSLKGMLDISRIQVSQTHSSITMRATPEQLVLAEKIIEDADRPKSEVIIDVAVLQVSRSRLRTMGTVVPTSATVSPVTAATGAATGTGLVKLGTVYGTSYATSLPSASFSFLGSDDNTKVLQNPQVRVLNDAKASLKIGDRVPIATGSYTAGGATGTGSALVNTQFQYLDVGVNVDITPHIHNEHEVTLKLTLEVSTVTGSVNIGGINQPQIGQRRIEHETRLQDGEVNLVGGILEDSETNSLGGYPWLLKIPILKYLFAQENKDREQNEIVFAITPHIVRSEDITDESLRLVDVGTNNNLSLRMKVTPPAEAPTDSTTPPAAPATPATPPATNNTSPQGQGRQKQNPQPQPQPKPPAAGGRVIP